MVRYTGSVIVPFAKDRVWNLMSDWRNLSKWDTNVSQSTLESGTNENDIGLGTHYDITFKMREREIPVAYECMRFDKPDYCEYVGLATLFKSKDCIRFEGLQDDSHSTKVTAEFNLNFRGLLSPLSFVFNGAMQDIGPKVMKDIDAFLNVSLTDTK